MVDRPVAGGAERSSFQLDHYQERDELGGHQKIADVVGIKLLLRIVLVAFELRSDKQAFLAVVAR